jgi:hypothetical protein
VQQRTVLFGLTCAVAGLASGGDWTKASGVHRLGCLACMGREMMCRTGEVERLEDVRVETERVRGELWEQLELLDACYLSGRGSMFWFGRRRMGVVWNPCRSLSRCDRQAG